MGVSIAAKEAVDQRLEAVVEAEAEDEGLEDRLYVLDTGDSARVNGTSSGSPAVFMVRSEGFFFNDHSRPSTGVDSTGPSLEPGRQREIQLVLLRLRGWDEEVAIMGGCGGKEILNAKLTDLCIWSAAGGQSLGCPVTFAEGDLICGRPSEKRSTDGGDGGVDYDIDLTQCIDLTQSMIKRVKG